MRFKNEAERLAHPFAGLMLGISWLEYYRFNLDRFNLDFIEQLNLNIDRIDLSEDYSDFPVEKKIKIWHLVLLLNQESAESLIEFARSNLQILPMDILPTAANLGKLSIINQFSKREIEPLINDLFSGAAQYGYLEILQYLVDLEIAPLLSLVIANDFTAFHLAAGNGQLSILKYFAEVTSEQLPQMISTNNFSVFSEAAQNGHFDVLKYLVISAPEQLPQMISTNNFSVFSEAAQNGHLDILKYLVLVAPEQLPQMISACDFAAFRRAMFYEQYKVCKYIAKIAPAQLFSMIQANNFEVFYTAFSSGQLKIIDFIVDYIKIIEYLDLSQYPTQDPIQPGILSRLIGDNNFQVFRKAARDNHLEGIKYLVDLLPEQSPQMINACNFEAFHNAATDGHIDMTKYLMELGHEQVIPMISADNFNTFRVAAYKGHLNIIKCLVAELPDYLPQMISACNFEAFHNAATHGHIDMTKYLMELGHEQVIPMISDDNFSTFRVAAYNGHLNIIKYMAAELPDYLPQMISANNFKVFHLVAEHGHLDVLKYLVTSAPEQLPEMISSSNFEAFRMAILYDQYKVCKYLARVAPAQLFRMIQANNFQVFYAAFSNSYLKIIDFIVDYLKIIEYLDLSQYPTQDPIQPGTLARLIGNNNFHVFRDAAKNNHLEVIKYLVDLLPEQLPQMISANNFEAFRNAAGNRHFEVMEHLVKIAPIRLLSQLFGADNYFAFRMLAYPEHHDENLLSFTKALEQSSKMLNDSYQYLFRRIFKNKRLHMINVLLSFAKNFGYAETHFQENEYSYLVHKQVNEFLNRLQREMSHFQEIHPSEEFDLSTLEDNVSEERGLYGYYVLRQLIRQLPVNRYGDEVYTYVNCLLSIPSIKQLIRLNATQTNLLATHCYANEQFAEQVDELLQLAVDSKNEQVMQQFLNSPTLGEIVQHYHSDKKLIEDIFTGVKNALAAYKSYHFPSDSECLNASAKALTFFINEQQNFAKAEIFCETLHAEVERAGSLRDILHRLKDFFEMSSKEFYPRSFTSYLADALAKLHIITLRNEGYTQLEVISELEAWLANYLARQEEVELDIGYIMLDD